jgi:hypothetical protein
MMSPSDKLARKAIRNPNMLVPWYLMAAYAYYVLDAPILTDALFDDICVRLDSEWDEIEHRDKGWVDRDDLAAGTRLSTAYPSLAMGAASALAGRAYRPPAGLLDALAACEHEMEQLCLALNARS